MESACFRKVGTALHCLPLSCPRSYPRISPLPILQSEQGVLASFQEIIAKIACVQRKDTAYFLRLIQLVSMLYDCRNIIALCALKTNITQNMGRPHCAATLILILLWHSKKWQDFISKHRIAQRRHFGLMLCDFFFTSRNAGLHSRLLCSASHPLGWFTFQNSRV